MANENNVHGIIPIGMMQGGPVPTRRFYVDVGNDTNIFIGDMVGAESDGGIEVADASEGTTMLGSVVGIFDTNMNPIDSPNSLTSTPYLASTTVGYVDVALCLPGSLFRTQIATAAYTDVFASAPIVAGSGSTTTGVSGHYLGTATTGASDFIILDKVDEPGNAWGAYVDVVITPCTSFFVAALAGV